MNPIGLGMTGSAAGLPASPGADWKFAGGGSAGWLLWPLTVSGLIWPALWNFYPIVFADTGTYLSQAMHGYVGWDRPIFYSLFLLPLHLGLTTWPVILVQAGLTVLVLDLVRRTLKLPSRWLLALIPFLAAATWLPWTVSELMPDLFTPLLVLLLCVLVVSAAQFRRSQRLAIAGLAAFLIATQQSSVPLAIALLAIFVPLRWSVTPAERNAAALLPMLAPALAIIALVLMNVFAFGRVSLSPYGNVFVLARVIYDGPGKTVLDRECPERGWRLCPYLDRFPASSDDFLWDDSSPIMLAGGHKAVSADADAIIREAIRTQPGRLLTATWDNALEQLSRFASGDGLESWNEKVGPWIDLDFPDPERARFHTARQQAGTLRVPPALAIVHRFTALAGIAIALLLAPIAWHRRHISAWFLAVTLVSLPLSAAITGGLSSPHDRYQSRIIWLPAAMAFLAVPALRQRRTRVCQSRPLGHADSYGVAPRASAQAQPVRRLPKDTAGTAWPHRGG